MQSGSTPHIKDNFQEMQLPSIADQELQLQELVQQGILTPEQAQAQLVGRSEMDGITLDPKLKTAQMEALAGLQDISSSGGMTNMDRANLNRIKSEEDAAARGKREAILSNAQARGMGGSGLELMSQMKNQQESASRTAQRDLDVAGMAQQRALQALMQGGDMAGRIQGQDFSQQAQTAQANDAISKFNAQNKQQVGMANVAANNDAQARNLAAKQSVSDINSNLKNQQQMHNKGLLQSNFENDMRKRQAQAGLAAQNAANSGQNSQNTANAWNQTGGMMLSAASMFSDERCKEEIEEFSPSDFLDSLTGYKFKYKDKKHGEGKHVGVMAQDLEKTEAGSKLVVDSPEGKIVDYAKAGPAIMASLASLNDRLKKMEGAE